MQPVLQIKTSWRGISPPTRLGKIIDLRKPWGMVRQEKKFFFESERHPTGTHANALAPNTERLTALSIGKRAGEVAKVLLHF